MPRNDCDILIPLFFFQGRDVEIIIPLKFYLEKCLGYSVKICSVFDPFCVDLYQPKLVLMENTIGSTFHVDFADYAMKRGFRVISLISEGLVIEAQQVEQGTWGHNKTRKILFDRLLAWNETQKKLISKHYPILKDKIVVTGALTFDRYKIYALANKKTFLKKYAKEKYQYVVGYAGFVFSGFDTGTQSLAVQLDSQVKEQLLLDEKKVRDMLRSTIARHPDVLFILKQHPGEPSPDREISAGWADEFENVLYLLSEEPVADIINICDIWIVYDSTTCLEAWLLNKPTITLMPSHNIEIRNDFYQGTLIAKTVKDLEQYVVTFTNEKKRFFQLSAIKRPARNKILKNMMNRTDGLNGAFTAQVVDSLFTSLPYKPKKSLISWQILYGAQHFFLNTLKNISFLPVLKRSVILKWLNEYDQYFVLEKRYLPYLRSFSRRHKKTLEGQLGFKIKWR